MNLSLLNLISNSNVKYELKNFYTDNRIIEYNSIEKYNEYLNSFHINNYEELSFDDYKNNFEFVLIVTDQSKRKVKNNILRDRFIPIKMIIINSSKNIQEQLKSKLIPIDFKWLKTNFLKLYKSLLREKKIDFENFIDNVDTCPFCKNNQFYFTHNYSKKNLHGVKYI